jgi:hypothetical protein
MALITIHWSECHMKKDAEVLRYMRERRKGTKQELAAARAGMSVKTARKYERAGRLYIIYNQRVSVAVVPFTRLFR